MDKHRYVNPSLSRRTPDNPHIPREGVSVRLSEREYRQPDPIVYCYIGEGLAARARIRVGDYLALEVRATTRSIRLLRAPKGYGGRRVTAGGGKVSPRSGSIRNCFIQVPFLKDNRDLLNELFPNGPGKFNLEVVDTNKDLEAVFSYDCQHQGDARLRQEHPGEEPAYRAPARCPGGE